MASLSELFAAITGIGKRLDAIQIPSPDAALASEVASLKSTVAFMTAEKAELVARIESIDIKLAESVASLDKAESVNKDLTNKVSALEAEKTSAEKKAADIVAGFSAPPAAEPKKNEAATVSRAAFEQMSHSERNAYIRNGGKIV
jgi:septal ring factor EnvC (AmiA/AmiB activator)